MDIAFPAELDFDKFTKAGMIVFGSAIGIFICGMIIIRLINSGLQWLLKIFNTHTMTEDEARNTAICLGHGCLDHSGRLEEQAREILGDDEFEYLYQIGEEETK